MKPLKLFTLSFCVLMLTACAQTWEGLKEDLNSIETPEWAEFTPAGTSEEPDSALFVESGNCPTIKVVEELGSVNQFSDIGVPQAYNLISNARITQAQNSCEFNGKTATVDLKLFFEGQTGPKAPGTGPRYNYPFFVAVTAPNGDILAKEVFSAQLDYTGGKTTASHYETLRHIIPISNERDGPKYKVLIGFQLTQDQLIYNRAIIAEREAQAKAAAEAAKAAARNPQPMAAPAPVTQAPVDNRAPVTYIEPELSAPQRVTGTADGPIIIYPQQ